MCVESLKKLQLTPHLVMCLIGFSLVASISVVAPILSIYLTSEMNMSAGIVGLVTAAFFISSALTEIFLGIIVPEHIK